jgi:Fur family zinc uptake transcriptional regulator
MAQIKEARPGASPPTVYRALDFLIEQGLAHKIGRMNLFVHAGMLPIKSPACFWSARNAAVLRNCRNSR